MPKLIRHDAVVEDDWVLAPANATLETLPAGRVIVPLTLWTSARDALRTRGDVGVWLAPTDDPATLARDVERICRHAEEDGGVVLLVRCGQESHQPRRAATGQRQDTSRQRVEGAGVADPFLAEQASRRHHDIVRRRPFGFIHNEDTVHARQLSL